MGNKGPGFALETADVVELPRAKLAVVQELLRANSLPDDDCGDPALYFCAIFDGDDLVAAGGLEPASSSALLRSIVVSPDYRASGLARRIVDHLLARAAQQGRLEVYLLTETAEHYFSRLGFQPVDRSDVPDGVANTRQFSTLCPQSACCMRLLQSSEQPLPA